MPTKQKPTNVATGAKKTEAKKYISPFLYLKDFVLSNCFVLISVILVWAKTLAFNYFANLLDQFPYVWRPITISFLIALVLFSPIFFLKKHKNKFALGLNLFFSSVMIVDLVYLRYFNSIPSVGILNTAAQSSDVMPAIASLFKITDLIFILDVVVLLFLQNPLSVWASKFKTENLKKKGMILTDFAVFLVAVLLLVNGFWQDYKSNGFFQFAVNNVIDNKIAAENYGVIGAHLFDIYRNVDQSFSKLSKADRDQAIAWTNQHKFKQTDNALTGVAAGKSVIMIQVESLQNFAINQKVEGQEITPNMNRLVASSHYFNNDYFEIGGGGTSDADMSANTSLFPLYTESAFVKFGEANYSSLAKELKSLGYSANVYHAYNRSFWNRNVAFKSLGFDKFFAEESYKNAGATIGLGLNDKDFLAKTADYIKTQPKPAFSYAITLTSHTPFDLPAKYSDLKLNGNYAELSRGYLQSIHYTDEALGQFLDQLKRDGLYDDSVIVLYGDHKAKIDTFNQGGVNFDADSLDNYKVPLIIKLPNQTQGEVHKKVSSHMDIMPTILNLVGKKTNSVMFGRDLFGSSQPFFSGVGLFNANTVFDGRNRIYTDNNSFTHCEKVNSKGIYTKTDDSACSGLADKANELKAYSDKLIRYNLFKYF